VKLERDNYVPSLRWRRAEYQALTRLEEHAKALVVPFITVTKPEYDHEQKTMKRTVREHVEPFAQQYKKKWGNRGAWIDFHPEIELEPMSGGKVPVAHVFDQLRELGSAAVPVVTPASPGAIVSAVAAIVGRDVRGVGVRIGFKDVMMPDSAARITSLLRSIAVDRSNADLVVDLEAPATYEPYEDFADGLVAAIEELGDLFAYRSFILIGSAFPEFMPIEKPGGELVRHDWNFYQVFSRKLPTGARIPTYGDYTIVPPSFSGAVDFRVIKTAGRLVYTTGNKWIVRKGGAFRDDREQMHDHCLHILNSGKFRGPGFSPGDDYIEKCAKREAGPSNATYWKQVGISHHIMHVLEELSNLAGAA
jgi:hypothetical protein